MDLANYTEERMRNISVESVTTNSDANTNTSVFSDKRGSLDAENRTEGRLHDGAWRKFVMTPKFTTDCGSKEINPKVVGTVPNAFWIKLTSKRLFFYYHRFRFYATIGGFSSKENCVSAAVNHRYHLWKCMSRAGFASNGFQVLLACSLFIFGRI